MIRGRTLFRTVVIITLLFQAVPVRYASGQVKSFNQDGLSFNYPDGWNLTDRSTPQAQHLILTKTGSSALIMVVSHREPILNYDQLYAARTGITTPFVQNMAQKLGLKESPDWYGSGCLKVGERIAMGFSLTGRIEGQEAVGDVYALISNYRYTHFIYVRLKKDEAEGNPASEMVRASLKIDPPASLASETEPSYPMSGGVLNGRAEVLYRPPYPPAAMSDGVSGVVIVQVMIDEKGKVISAKTVSGPVQLRAVSEQAALRSKFSPTTQCGKPVRIMGVVTYNFMR